MGQVAVVVEREAHGSRSIARDGAVRFANRFLHAVRVLPAIFTVEGERLVDDLDDGNGHRRRKRADARRRLRHRGEELLVDRVGDVNHAAGQKLEHRCPDRPKVRTRVDLFPSRARLLGRHVGRRAHRGSRAGRAGVGRELAKPGNAEIEEFYPPAAREEDVVGFDVAVDDVLVVRRGEHVEHLVAHEKHFLDDERARLSLETMRERLAVEQLHHQKDAALVVLVLVHYLRRAGMVDRVGGPPLTQEKRPLISLLPTASSACSIFTATRLPFLQCVAEYTAAMPPTPMSSSSRHLSFSVCPTRCLERSMSGSFASSIR